MTTRMVYDNGNLLISIEDDNVKIATRKTMFSGTKKECDDKILELKLKDNTNMRKPK